MYKANIKLLSLKKDDVFSDTVYHVGEQSGSCQISGSFILGRQFTLFWHKVIFFFSFH